ncbi:serine/threonine-protein kinase [Streptomyces sp. NPDC051985]|uniref:serine/threonine-protein kinase n=1 Tax=Streptomyces sp. NPDC051985 TaxID=3155807 RepID=UPI00344A7596
MQPLAGDEPTTVGPYRLLGRLGSGGMGRVYLGRSAGGRTVAVKIVHPHFALDEEFRARFRREVAAARRVGGAWTAPVLDADPDAPVPWVATAYAAGPSLAAAVADGGPLPAHTVRALGAGLAEALAAVHELGLVHRDVKPSNVLLTLDGPLLIDFGIARATDGTASLTSSGVSLGSPGYMSPEQILGKGATGAADVFSLGAVLAYAANGEPPFPGDSSAALLYKVVHEEPELGALGGELRAVAEACLAKEPGHRPGPAEVARRLAPEGAARLVTGGWLPGALVERVSRSAVQVLNLETAEVAVPASGPVEFSSPSVGTGPSAGTATVVPEPRDAPPGGVSVSVAATSAPGADGRGRRVSCTVALAVAGALAAVTVGVGFLVGPWRGDDRDTGASADSSGASASAKGDGRIPAAYLGTWEGTATALSGNLPIGTFRITVAQAAVGDELGRLRQTDQLGGVCTDVLTLKAVTSTKLVASSAGVEGNHDGCDPGPNTVYLTPSHGDLVYTSDSSAEGNPVAVMSKTGD